MRVTGLLVAALAVVVGIVIITDSKNDVDPSPTAPQAARRPAAATSRSSCDVGVTATFHSRHLVSHVSGSVRLAAKKRTMALDVVARAPRRFEVYLYDHRSTALAISNGYTGSLHQRMTIPVDRLTRYRYVVIAAWVHRPARHHHRAHAAQRVLARVRVGGLLNHLIHCASST